MTQYAAFYRMLDGLAELFETEMRGGGHDVADGLREITSKSHLPLPKPHSPLPEMLDTALGINPHPVADLVKEAMPLLDWHFSGLSDGRIRKDIAEQMLTTELVGPDGMLYHEKFRVGLFSQSANLDYVTREHAAVECFVMLGGSGLWQAGDAQAAIKRAGDHIFHPSMTPHASITKDEPMIAAWFWTGDIAYEKYTLTG